MKLKKFLSLMLALVMLIGALPVLSAPVAATDTVNRDMFGNEISYYGRAALAQLPNAAVLLYAYDQLAAGYDALAEQITVYDGVTPLSREDYDTAFDAYMRDHAEQFWIPNSHLIYSNGTTVTKIEPKYTFTAGELSAAKATFNIAANNLLDGVTASMSDYDIELLLHDRLAGEIAYVNADNAHNAYGALVEGEAVCEGYAEALQTLLHRAGVSAFLATGNSADPSNGYLQAHMWNYVCVDGAYYQTDLTWDDQGSTLYHAYFNQTDATMGEDHQLDAVAYSLPTCTATAANYFVRQDGMLDTYTVDSVAALLSAGDLTAHVYIPGDKDAFVTWYNTNIAAIAQAAGVTGGFSYSRRTLGREMVLTITPSTPTTTTTVITSTSRPTTTATEATTTTTKAADVTLPMVSFTSTSQVPTATSPTQTTLTTTVTAPEESGGLTYEIADGKVTITGYTGSATELVIPSTIEGYPVTAIGQGAFYCCDSLTSITVPNGVTKIGDYAFSNCQSLKSFKIPESVIEIGSYAFECCFMLKSLYFGSGVASIGEWAFVSCDGLEAVYVTDVASWCAIDFATASSNPLCNLDENGPKLYLNQTYVTMLILPSNVTQISNYAFYSYSYLEGITIPKNVTAIGEYAFDWCTSLANVYYVGLENDKANIQINWDTNGSLATATWHYNICSGGTSHTYDNASDKTCNICGAVREIPIPEQLLYTILNGEVTITDYTGTETDLVIPSTIEGSPVTAIGKEAFSGCNSLVSVTIPDSVTSIGNSVFSSCKSLTRITIPDSVTSMGDRMFTYCTSLTSVIIPDGVTNIGNQQFYYCSSLTSIVIPDSVTSIGYDAFYCCTSLTSVVLPNSVISIGNAAFSECSSLTSFTIPDGVVDIEYNVFQECKSLTSITVPDGIISIGGNAFSGCESLAYITIPNSVTSIGEGAFSGCKSLAHITIPNSVTSIGEGAFSGCESLAHINIPDSVISIGDDAFFECKSLVSIMVDPNNRFYCSVDGVLFDKEKTSLLRYPAQKTDTTYVIPDSVTSVEGRAFSDCVFLVNVIIGSGMAEIGEWAFSYCTSIVSVTIPNSVTSIKKYAFYCCLSLKSVIIENRSLAIGHRAFYYCTSITEVWYTGSSADKGSVSIGIDNQYLQNATWHYNTCAGEHTYTADCDAECDLCEWVRTAPTEHTYSTVKSDDTHHWGVCECGYVSVKSPHNYKNFKFDDLKHWHECDCGAIDTENVYGHGYSPNFDDDAHWLECFCGHTLEEREPHVFDRTESNDTHHWTECTCGKVASKTAHTYNAGVVTKAATCKVTGVKTYTCTGCGATKTETIAKKAHSYNDATCTKAKTCKVCGVTSGSKLGHSYKKYLVKATLTANGKDGYKCSRCGYVTSTTKTIYRPTSFKLSTTAYTYNGAVKTPTVTVKNASGTTLTKNTHYTVTYASGRKNAGTYKVTVKMMGNYTGTKTLTFKINPINISKCKVSLSKTAFTYNGKMQAPTVTVKNASGTKLTNKTHYTITYASGRKNVGTYKVTVKMMGNYTGTKVLTFTIKPKAASINTLTAKSKALSVKLNRQLTQSTGYQIQYSTSKSFSGAKTKTITSYKTSTTTLTGLKAKTTYYVRVRTYKTVGGTKIYSNWSSYKYKKTK